MSEKRECASPGYIEFNENNWGRIRERDESRVERVYICRMERGREGGEKNEPAKDCRGCRRRAGTRFTESNFKICFTECSPPFSLFLFAAKFAWSERYFSLPRSPSLSLPLSRWNQKISKFINFHVVAVAISFACALPSPLYSE